MIADEERHEFVLLSDVLGVPSLVDMVHSNPEGTPSSVLGPFHIAGAPEIAYGCDLKRHYQGPLLLVEACLRAPDGSPVPGARLDIWQTEPNGLYSSQDPEQETCSFHGIMTARADGRYAFTTVKPVSYTVPADGPVGDIPNASGRRPLAPLPPALHRHRRGLPPPGHRGLPRRRPPTSTKTPSSACATTW